MNCLYFHINLVYVARHFFVFLLSELKIKEEKDASVFTERTEDSSATQYFQFYGYLSQQQNMMQGWGLSNLNKNNAKYKVLNHAGILKYNVGEKGLTSSRKE